MMSNPRMVAGLPGLTVAFNLQCVREGGTAVSSEQRAKRGLQNTFFSEFHLYENSSPAPFDFDVVSLLAYLNKCLEN